MGGRGEEGGRGGWEYCFATCLQEGTYKLETKTIIIMKSLDQSR